MKLTSFKNRVLDVVRNIPPGETITYGEVAEAAGRPGATRAVGNIMSRNFDPAIPCHRVVRSDGTPGGYNRGVDRKMELLAKENLRGSTSKFKGASGENRTPDLRVTNASLYH